MNNYKTLLKTFGLERIADAEYNGLRLPLLVVHEVREWPWEPPVVIESKISILKAIQETDIGTSIIIDGRMYFLCKWIINAKNNLFNSDDHAIWELATYIYAKNRIKTRDAWDLWHFPRPFEQMR